MIAIGLTAVLVKLAIISGLLYTAFHFISKHW